MNALFRRTLAEGTRVFRTERWKLYREGAVTPGHNSGRNASNHNCYVARPRRQMGLTDFTSTTQELIAVEMLRSVHVVEKIKAGDIAGAIGPAARKWAAFPKGPGLGDVQPAQPFVKYEDFRHAYHAAGGTGQ
jgi:hypothetical protein